MKTCSLGLALSNLPKTSQLGKMVNASVTSSSSKKSIYEKNVKDTFKSGIGNLMPCSLLAWKPGTPMKVNGASGRIKWGLSDGNLEYVVVVLDCQIAPSASDYKSDIGIVPVSAITSCECAGYIHKNHCSPKNC